MHIGQSITAVRKTTPERCVERRCVTRNTKCGIRHTRKGFSLAEAVLATSVLTFASLGVVMPFSSGAAVRAAGYHRTLAAALAVDLMEQVMTTAPDQIVAVWDGYSEAQGAVIKDFTTSTPFSDPEYDGFSRSCACGYVYVAQQSGTASPNFITITITVARKGDDLASVTRLLAL